MKWIGIVTSLIGVLLMNAGCYAAHSPPEVVNRSKVQGDPTWVRYTDNAEGAFSICRLAIP